MASETTFDHWKVFFSRGKARKRALTRDFNRLRISEFTQNFWVFLFYIADFWQTFWVIWKNGSNWSNLRLKMSISAYGRLKNMKISHIYLFFIIVSRSHQSLRLWYYSDLTWHRLCNDLAQSVFLRLRYYLDKLDSAQIWLRQPEQKVDHYKTFAPD